MSPYTPSPRQHCFSRSRSLMPCLSELSRGTCRWRVRSCILLALRRAGGSQRQGISAGINLTHRGTQHTGGRFRRIRRIRRKKSNVDQSRPTDCCVRCKRERSSATLRGSTSRWRRRSDECPRPGCAWLRNPDARNGGGRGPRRTVWCVFRRREAWEPADDDAQRKVVIFPFARQKGHCSER